MSYDSHATSNREYASFGFTSGVLGLILVLLIAASRFNILPEALGTLGLVILILPFAMLIASSTRDEFIKELLQASALKALWVVFGVYMVVIHAHEEINEFIDLFAGGELPLQPMELAPLLGLLAFFITFHVKRFRSEA